MPQVIALALLGAVSTRAIAVSRARARDSLADAALLGRVPARSHGSHREEPGCAGIHPCERRLQAGAQVVADGMDLDFVKRCAMANSISL